MRASVTVPAGCSSSNPVVSTCWQNGLSRLLATSRFLLQGKDLRLISAGFSSFQWPPILESRDGMLSLVIGSKDIAEFKSRCQFRQE